MTIAWLYYLIIVDGVLEVLPYGVAVTTWTLWYCDLNRLEHIMETLPLDILLYIIDLLAGEDDVDVKSLRILSQTCKSMVPLCRKHLFSSLRLCREFELNSERFSDLLLKNPDIARYVRSLNYDVYLLPISDHELNILETLKERSSLQSIELSSGLRWFHWNILTESVRSSLVSLIQLPTVTFLNIHTFDGFPATALSGCDNLIDLKLGEINLAPPEVNQVISRNKIPAPVSLYIDKDTYGLAALLNSASLHAGDPIIDFSRLQKAEFEVESRDDLNQVSELIKATTRLEYFCLDTDTRGEWTGIVTYQKVLTDDILLVLQPLQLAGLGASLAISNTCRTLKFLDLYIVVVGDDYDPLCGLDRELKFIAGNNILEELKLYVVVQDDLPCRTESKDWSAFDSVLTESGAFPMLHRVLVEIWWYTASRNLSEQDAVLESLKEDKFPRLVKSKAVEFNFHAKIQDVSWCVRWWITMRIESGFAKLVISSS